MRLSRPSAATVPKFIPSSISLPSGARIAQVKRSAPWNDSTALAAVSPPPADVESPAVAAWNAPMWSASASRPVT